MVPRDEIVKAIGGNHGHRGDVDIDAGERSSIDLARQQFFGEGESARLATQRASSDAREMKGTAPELPVERRQIRNHRIEIGHRCLPSPLSAKRLSAASAERDRTAYVLHPSAVVAGFGDPAYRNRIRRIPHRELLAAGEF